MDTATETQSFCSEVFKSPLLLPTTELLFVCVNRSVVPDGLVARREVIYLRFGRCCCLRSCVLHCLPACSPVCPYAMSFPVPFVQSIKKQINLQHISQNALLTIHVVQPVCSHNHSRLRLIPAATIRAKNLWHRNTSGRNGSLELVKTLHTQPIGLTLSVCTSGGKGSHGQDL